MYVCRKVTLSDSQKECTSERRINDKKEGCTYGVKYRNKAEKGCTYQKCAREYCEKNTIHIEFNLFITIRKHSTSTSDFHHAMSAFIIVDNLPHVFAESAGCRQVLPARLSLASMTPLLPCAGEHDNRLHPSPRSYTWPRLAAGGGRLSTTVASMCRRTTTTYTFLLSPLRCTRVSTACTAFCRHHRRCLDVATTTASVLAHVAVADSNDVRANDDCVRSPPLARCFVIVDNVILGDASERKGNNAIPADCSLSHDVAAMPQAAGCRPSLLRYASERRLRPLARRFVVVGQCDSRCQHHAAPCLPRTSLVLQPIAHSIVYSYS